MRPETAKMVEASLEQRDKVDRERLEREVFDAMWAALQRLPITRDRKRVLDAVATLADLR